MNPILIKEAVFKIFSSQQRFETLAEVAECPIDPESAEECGPFIGRIWMEISSLDWKTHFYAISFFTTAARREFLPSVIINSLDKFNDTHLAFQSYMYHFDNCESDSDLFELTGSEAVSMNCIYDWISYMTNKCTDALETDRILRIIDRIDKFKN